MQPQQMAAISSFTGYPTSSAKARPLVEPQMRDNPDIYVSDETYARLVPGKDISQKDMRARMRTWTTLKTSSAH
ncbi:Putrescine-binding periplasmic protein precursor [compost metagenome]